MFAVFGFRLKNQSFVHVNVSFGEGDGNFHVSPLVMMDDQDEVARAEDMIERLNMRTIAMEGTCTGEHGIGQGKRRFLKLEHGAGAEMMTAIKKSRGMMVLSRHQDAFQGQIAMRHEEWCRLQIPSHGAAAAAAC